MKNIIQLSKTLLPHQHFDALAVGIVDFKSKTFDVVEVTNFEGELQSTTDPVMFFDLASVTKPLTNSLTYFLEPQQFTESMQYCLNHRGGLPAWGLLPHQGWREIINSYTIQKSETLYSDYSALRVMLEFDKISSKGMKKTCQRIWDKDMMNWLDLPSSAPTPQYGMRNGIPSYSEVHDPNAYTVKEFCSHAGLFSTIQGVAQTLLNYQEATDFILQVQKDLKQHERRFSFGWDRVVNPSETLAGKGCHLGTFGHLGFTGTSIWIDPVLSRASIILSNGVKNYWYDKAGLNEIRRGIGELVWAM